MTDVKVLVIPLVLVLVGTQLAYATNESSYKYWLVYPHNKVTCQDIHCKYDGWRAYEWSNDPSYQYGFNKAKINYQGANSIPQDEFSMDFQVTNNDAIGICHAKTVADPDACIHGWVRGFQQWCRTNTKECAWAAIDGGTPIQLMAVGGYDNGWPQPSFRGSLLIHSAHATNSTSTNSLPNNTTNTSVERELQFCIKQVQIFGMGNVYNLNK